MCSKLSINENTRILTLYLLFVDSIVCVKIEFKNIIQIQK